MELISLKMLISLNWGFKIIKESDIAVIKTEYDYPYYLLKLLKDPFEVIIMNFHQVIELYKAITGNLKATNDGDICYIHWKRKTVISAFLCTGQLPNLNTSNPETTGERGRNILD